MTIESSHTIVWTAFKVTAVSFLQVFIFIVLYEAVVEVYVSNFGPMNKIFGFSMQLDNGTYLLSILAGVNAVVQEFVNQLNIRLMTVVLCTVVWIAYWGNIAEVVPNRVALLSVLGMLSFLSSVLLIAPGDEAEHSLK